MRPASPSGGSGAYSFVSTTCQRYSCMRDAHKGQVAGRTGSGSNYTIVVHTRRIRVRRTRQTGGAGCSPRRAPAGSGTALSGPGLRRGRTVSVHEDRDRGAGECDGQERHGDDPVHRFSSRVCGCCLPPPPTVGSEVKNRISGGEELSMNFPCPNFPCLDCSCLDYSCLDSLGRQACAGPDDQ